MCIGIDPPISSLVGYGLRDIVALALLYFAGVGLSYFLVGWLTRP